MISMILQTQKPEIHPIFKDVKMDTFWKQVEITGRNLKIL